LGTKYLVVLCAGPTLPLAKQSLDEAPYKLFGAIAKLASITSLSLPFSYWIDNLGFVTEGKLAAIFIKPSLGVSNWPVIYFINYTPTIFLASFITAPSTSFLAPLPGIGLHFPTSTWHDQTQSSFLAPLPGKRRLLHGEFRTHILYFVLSFALLYFYLFHFIKNTKKLVSFIVDTLLLPVHYVVP
jgi:hypothetical protein